MADSFKATKHKPIDCSNTNQKEFPRQKDQQKLRNPVEIHDQICRYGAQEEEGTNSQKVSWANSVVRGKQASGNEAHQKTAVDNECWT